LFVFFFVLFLLRFFFFICLTFFFLVLFFSLEMKTLVWFHFLGQRAAICFNASETRFSVSNFVLFREVYNFFFFFFLSWAFFLRCLHTIGEKKMELNLKNEFKEIKQMKKETDKNYLGLGSADEIW